MEVAGVVLTVFSTANRAIELSDGTREVRGWWRFRRQYLEHQDRLRLQELVFRQSVGALLEKASQPPSLLDELAHFDWSAESKEAERIKLFLGDSYTDFRNNAEHIEVILTELKQHFGNQDRQRPGEMLKFVVRQKQIRELLADLERTNKELESVVETASVLRSQMLPDRMPNSFLNALISWRTSLTTLEPELEQRRYNLGSDLGVKLLISCPKDISIYHRERPETFWTTVTFLLDMRDADRHWKPSVLIVNIADRVDGHAERLNNTPGTEILPTGSSLALPPYEDATGNKVHDQPESPDFSGNGEDTARLSKESLRRAEQTRRMTIEYSSSDRKPPDLGNESTELSAKGPRALTAIRRPIAKISEISLPVTDEHGLSSLENVLGTCGSLQRLQLAVALSRIIMQVPSTFLYNDWGKKDVHLYFNTVDDCDFKQPFLACSDSTSRIDYDKTLASPNAIYSLGVILLELALGRAIEDQFISQDLDAAGEPNQFSKTVAVARLQHSVHGTTNDAYADPIRWCLRFSSMLGEDRLDREMLAELYEEVFLPLNRKMEVDLR